MKKINYFDEIIRSDTDLELPLQNNLAEFIFHRIPGRDENSTVILSHIHNEFMSISLNQLRFITGNLFKEYEDKGIKRGDTVLVACLNGNNELFTALQFLALTAFGVRVLMPMFMEINDLSEWIGVTDCKALIISEKEIIALKHHETEKQNLVLIKDITAAKNIPSYDLIEDFNLNDLLHSKNDKIDKNLDQIINKSISCTNLGSEALIITTSGSSGKSRLILYEQGSFIKSCLSYEKAGLFSEDKLGGRGFTPLFCHTMGIRTFYNALWTGNPVCLITANLFLEKPEIARYLLIKMKPEHITGGPSVFNLILELMRYFPELKEILAKSFRTLVSSGAPPNNSTLQNFRKFFDITLHNAFGTTETQQVLTTLLLDDPEDPDLHSLGAPLPGTVIGLKRYSKEENLFQLYVNSPFGMKRIFCEEQSRDDDCPEGFYYTGDIVSLLGPGRLCYAGRENVDFFKDGFGVKIPIHSLEKYYLKLLEQTDHVEYVPINSHPGLAALIFVNNKSLPPGKIIQKNLISRYSQLIGEINNNLFTELMPFEFQHRVIKRIAVVNSILPLTIKGNVSKYKIHLLYKDIIAELCDPFSSDLSIAEIKVITKDSFNRHLNPYIGHLLSNLGIDNSFHRAEKDTLYTYRRGAEEAVLDFTGGFGTNLLGHNNKEIQTAAITFLQNNEVAISDQGSSQKYAGLLAEELNRIVGNKTGKEFNVILGSTGSEAVEIAIHHAFFEWKKGIEDLEQKQFQEFGAAGPLVSEVWSDNRLILSYTPVNIIALKNAFHGHSSGSRAMLGNNKKRDYFKNILALNTIFIDDESNDWKDELIKKVNESVIKIKVIRFSAGSFITEDLNFSCIIAAIAEPVIGEGGVRQVNRELLKTLSQFNFPLIMDEIQCGLGRTGSFLGSDGIDADYYLFAKALGGGIEKISAVLISRFRYKEEFGEYYSSTFANGGFAAKLALKTLSIIERERIPERAKEAGKMLSDKLNAVRLKYPEVIKEITGCGLMQGIKFADFSYSDDVFLRNLYKEKFSGYVFASFLLYKHGIRILPTLSAPNTLRVEPSSFINESEINKLVDAVSDLARIISNLEMYELFRHLMNDDTFDDNKNKPPSYGWLYNKIDNPQPGAVKVAFIAHFTNPANELRLIEKDFYKASDTGLMIFLNHIKVLMQMKPLLLFSKNLFNGRIHFSFYLLPIDTPDLERLNRKGKRQKVVSKIQQTIDAAARDGAKIISLGAYTSIISNNGSTIVEPGGCKVVTGNTLTAASGIRRILERIKKDKSTLTKPCLGIVGAGGNIGSVIANALINSDVKFEKIYLIGKNTQKLLNIKRDLDCDEARLSRIEVTSDLSKLKNCNIIISACNTSDPIIFPHHLDKNKTVLISDLSVPASLSSETKKMKNVTFLSFSAFVNLSEDPDFIMSSATPEGTSYCCAAEPILLALEAADLDLKGKLNLKNIRIITQLADKYHFFDNMKAGKSFNKTLAL